MENFGSFRATTFAETGVLNVRMRSAGQILSSSGAKILVSIIGGLSNAEKQA